MDVDTVEYIYPPGTMISPHTGKPLADPSELTTKMVFWCQLCDVKLGGPVQARQHMVGKSHESRYSQNSSTPKNESKRKLDNVQHKQEPASKKSKEITKTVPDKSTTTNDEKGKEKASVDAPLKCEDCNIEFQPGNYKIALQHFKGKKHIKTIASRLAAKQSQYSRGGQNGASGRGGRGRGRGGNFRTGGFYGGNSGPGFSNNNYKNSLPFNDRNAGGFNDSKPDTMNPNMVYGDLMSSLHGEIHRLKQRLYEI